MVTIGRGMSSSSISGSGKDDAKERRVMARVTPGGGTMMLL